MREKMQTSSKTLQSEDIHRHVKALSRDIHRCPRQQAATEEKS